MVSDAGLTLKELAPNLLKLSLIENKILSMAVRMPTRQAIPTAMMSRVRKDRKKLDFIDPTASFTFSLKSMMVKNEW
jgi:hypothetical protein